LASIIPAFIAEQKKRRGAVCSIRDFECVVPGWTFWVLTYRDAKRRMCFWFCGIASVFIRRNII
jgi:hypothetical protein